jgi:hypothetical protein
MMRISQGIVMLLFLFLSMPAHAKYDPRTVPNNQFGIHVVDPTDLDGVEKLVNSNGGEWGYVKFVIPETDRNTGKWDSVFRELRRRKIIPIVRIATRVGDNGWEKPTEETLRDWPAFLNSLSWPIENRYVILFNEPNHAGEWGGEIDPYDFAQKSIHLAKKLKEASEDYFILPAGIDVSAQSDGRSMSADTFLREIYKKLPEYFTIFDGWNSHSYPNPAFSAPPSASGRGSLRSFEWESHLLRSLGVTKTYPILIGETGWAHKEGIANTPSLLPTKTVANYIKIAGETIWQHPNIFAVIPFIYDYQEHPFDIFSWKKQGGNGFHDQYAAYQGLKKNKGQPIQKEAYALLSDPLPEKLVAGSLYQFPIELVNNGQAIISSEQNYYLSINDPSLQFGFTAESIPLLEPDQSAYMLMSLRTPEKRGLYIIELELKKPAKAFNLAKQTIEVIPPPSLKIQVQLGWRQSSEATQASVLVYDGNEIIEKFTNLSLKNGTISTPGILRIVPGQFYRIVTIVPYYLPRQSIQQIGDQVTLVQHNRFLPVDVNNDQQLTSDDFFALVRQKPSTILPRFFGP